MSLTRLVKEPNFQGVSSSSLASARVFTRGNIVNLYLRFLESDGTTVSIADMKSEVTGAVNVKVNGVSIIQADVTFLLDRQKYFGDSIGAGNVASMLPIPMELSYLPTPEGRRVFALGTKDINTITVELNTGTLTNVSSIELFTEVDNEETRVIGEHIRIDKFARNFGSTGKHEVSDLPFQDKNVIGYLGAHITMPGSAVVSTVEVKRNGVVILDQIPPELNQVLLEKEFRTPQSGYFHVDFGRGRALSSLLPMANTQSFLWEIVWAGAAPNNYNVYTERVFRTL